MRAPHAPGSLSAFFLYADTPGGNDEIDIEIHNDGTHRAILTSWVAGRETRSAEIGLPFDPAAAMHTYTIRWQAAGLTFLADGKELAAWKGRYPRDPMRVMANVWWPVWLTCTPLESDRELIIESLTLAPAAAKP
jgi:beta-glucanase (GH16 family)